MSESITKTEIKHSYNMRNSIVSYYLLAMFTFFELFLSNQYAKARTDKFILFICLTSALTIAVLAISLTYYLDKEAPIESRVVEAVPIFRLSATDYSFLAFFLFAVLSTLFSEHKLDSLLGSAGRDNGLLLIALYLFMYLIVSRFYIFKEYVLIAFLVTGCIISLLAVINFFYIDPLHIMVGYGDSVVADFGTTIGNKNTIASYMCIFLPFAMMMFTLTNKKYIEVTCAVAIACGYTGLLCANSSSAYLGFAAMVYLMLFICVRNFERLKKLALGFTVMFASGVLLRIFSKLMNDNSKGFESIAQKLIYSKLSYILVAVFLIIYLILYAIKVSNIDISNWPKKQLTIIVAVLGTVVIAVVGAMFVHYTFIDKTSDIGSLSHLLRFDERWGTHRGYFWIKGLEAYSQFDFVHKLFGSGCDTFFHVFSPYFDELSARFHNSSTDCAHNEYLNYLVTQGLLGLTAYLSILVTTVSRAFKTAKSNKLILIFIAPVICYCAQAVVNIYQPITTPFLFIFIALCECLSRGSHPANKLTD